MCQSNLSDPENCLEKIQDTAVGCKSVRGGCHDLHCRIQAKCMDTPTTTGESKGINKWNAEGHSGASCWGLWHYVALHGSGRAGCSSYEIVDLTTCSNVMASKEQTKPSKARFGGGCNHQKGYAEVLTVD